MKKINRLFLLFLIFVFTINLWPTGFVQAVNLVAPTIVNIDQSRPETLSRPLITGVTSKNTEVLVYIDNEYIGNAHVNISATASDNFYFQPTQNMAEGSHEVMVVAKDRTSLVLSPPSNIYGFFIAYLPAPTLVNPNISVKTQKQKPIISGLTRSGSFVHVYIDGVYNGKTTIVNNESGTANFAYKPFLNLSLGRHNVWVVAEDISGRKSAQSNILEFNIEQKLPAPLIFQPVVNNSTRPDQPFIVGNTKNNIKVRVYIDHVLDGEFRVINHKSGTANFAYKPFLPLKAGSHIVYTEAVDMQGKVSSWSNIIYFKSGRVIKPAISEEGVEEMIAEEPPQTEETVKPSPDKEEIKTEDTEEEQINNEESQPAEEGAINDIEDILQDDQQAVTVGDSGLINESKERQSRLNINLIIFILFLVAVIGWIFWVNRELIKEKREQSDEENKNNNPKLDI